MPVGYELALENRWAHYFEHISFFVTAILFWWPVIGAPPLPSPLELPGAVRRTRSWRGCPTACSGPVSACHARRCTRITSTESHSATATTRPDDQQLAGLIMWVPGDVLFLIILLGLFVAYHASTRNARKRASIASSMRWKPLVS